MAKKVENEIFWQNYLIYSTIYKFNRGIKFDSYDYDVVQEALTLFPNNDVIKQCDKIINYGEEPILIANEFDSKAIEAYEKKEYENAIKYWEEAIKIIDNDDSYYLNIAQSYLSLQKNNEALEALATVKNKNLIGSDGKYQYLMGIYFFSKQNSFKACILLNEAIELGNKDAINAKKAIGCKY